MPVNDIFSVIQSMYPTFTKSEKKVADFVFNTPEKVLYTSITDLAEMCGVGDTTVFRFCKALKLNGYQDFKMLLAQAIASGNGMEDAVVGKVSPEDDVLSLGRKALSTNIAALNETFELLDGDAIAKAANMIAAAKRIHFFGMGSSGVTALEAKQKFMRILPNVEYTADCHMQYMTAALMDSSDLAIAFSYSGSTTDVIDILKIAKKNGCKIICITRFARTQLTNLADVVLLCGSNEGPLQGGSLSTTFAQLYLLDVLYLQYFIKHYEKSKENKAKTTESISSKLL